MPEQLPPTPTPCTTPSRIRRGGRIGLALFLPRKRAGSTEGSPTQYPYTLMHGFAPSPKPIVSRFTPTIPVRAPPNGSSAEGEL